MDENMQTESPLADPAAPARRFMHPDDFEALLAWVTAKRFQERLLSETFSERAVYFSILGPSLPSS